MKNTTILTFCTVLFFLTILLPSALHGAPAHEGGAAFRENVGEREWVLSELRSGGRTTSINRSGAGSQGFFTISFREDRGTFGSRGQVRGLGAPNQYFGAYTAGANKTLNIGSIARTIVPPREGGNLGESDFFNYLLPRVTRWEFYGGKLELYSSNRNGSEAVLIFTPR